MLFPGTNRRHLGALLSLLAVLCFPPGASAEAGRTSFMPTLRTAYGKLPLAFEANRGQAARQTRFLTHGKGYSLYLNPQGVTLTLAKSPGHHLESRPDGADRPASRSALEMRLAGASSHPRISGLDPLPGKVNYLIGNDPRRWHTGVDTYRKVQYTGVYPGVDLVYYGSQRQLEYDFVLTPHVDPGVIRLDFQGAQHLRIGKDGDLAMDLPGGVVRWNRPIAYQPIAGRHRPVAGRYVLLGKNQVGFQVAKYDACRPLVIDPVLIYSTYFGGAANDEILGIAVDSGGNAYITGDTASHASNGTTDAFVAKLNSSGTALVYSTFVGGSSNDTAYGIAIDANGNAYITGQTQSTDFPTTNGAYQTANKTGTKYTAFVSVLNAAGSGYVYSTYLGGSNTDTGFGIAVDANGNAYIAGQTKSKDFPTTSGAIQTSYGVSYVDAFVTALNAAGTTLIYSTFLGSDNTNSARSITLDSAGDAYVTGQTSSRKFPVTPGAFQTTSTSLDVFVAKLNPTGTGLIYSTYLGGSNPDFGNSIAIDGAGNAYVTGYTKSTNFPVTPGAFQTALQEATGAFVTKLNPTGTGLVYSTYLGGTGGDDEGNAIAVDVNNHAIVTGQTHSPDYPTTPGAFQTVFNAGYSDAFITKLNAAGSGLIYSTYLGGNHGDYGMAIALYDKDHVFIGGTTASTNFPVMPNAFQRALTGALDGFISCFRISITEEPNLYFQNQSTGQLAVWFLSGMKATGAAYITPGQNPGWKAVAAPDLNGDGQPDLVFQNTSTGQLAYWLLNGTTATGAGYITPTPPANWVVVASADLNGDGHPDLILQNTATGQLVVWYLNGTSTTGAAYITPNQNPDWRCVGASDVNGDGQPDLIFQNVSTGQLAVWYMNGTTATGAAYITPNQSAAWRAVSVGDYNGDNQPDIVFQNSTTGQIALWFLNGTAVSTAGFLSPTPPANWVVVGPH